MSEDVIIAKTVEEEARNALDRAVQNTIRDYAPTDLIRRYGIMVLQHLVLNDALDRLDHFVEECSVRVTIDRQARELIKTQEIEPYLKKIVVNTSRYIQPYMPRRKYIGNSLRNELITRFAQSLPRKATIYKGMPGPKDLTIMAEATLIVRKYESKETIYVASVDNHFKPNPVQIAYDGGRRRFTGEIDHTIRDKLATEFGFTGEDPKQVLYVVATQFAKTCK